VNDQNYFQMQNACGWLEETLLGTVSPELLLEYGT
jgi:hypothetical protein